MSSNFFSFCFSFCIGVIAMAVFGFSYFSDLQKCSYAQGWRAAYRFQLDVRGHSDVPLSPPQTEEQRVCDRTHEKLPL